MLTAGVTTIASSATSERTLGICWRRRTATRSPTLKQWCADTAGSRGSHNGSRRLHRNSSRNTRRSRILLRWYCARPPRTWRALPRLRGHRPATPHRTSASGTLRPAKSWSTSRTRMTDPRSSYPLPLEPWLTRPRSRREARPPLLRRCCGRDSHPTTTMTGVTRPATGREHQGRSWYDPHSARSSSATPPTCSASSTRTTSPRTAPGRHTTTIGSSSRATSAG